MASQHAKRFVLRNTIKTLPTNPARTTAPVFKRHRSQGPISTSLRHTRPYQTFPFPPDGWAYTVFDCDYDFDIVGDISHEASVVANEPGLNLMVPKNKEHVVEMLNEGLFHHLLQKFLDRDFRDGVVYLGALAMRLGAKIGIDDMRVLRELVGCVRMFEEAREQMRAALKGYNPAGGYPWVFDCLGRLEEEGQGGVEGENLDSQSVDESFEKDFSKIPMSIKLTVNFKGAGGED